MSFSTLAKIWNNQERYRIVFPSKQADPSQKLIRRSLLAAVLLIAGAAPIAAQSSSQVIPVEFAKLEGESHSTYPFGMSSALRIHYYYLPKLFKGKKSIRGISYRFDAGRKFAAKTVEFRLSASTSYRTALYQMNHYFNGVHGKDKTVVMKRRKVSFPAVSNIEGPRPFGLHLVFDKAFPYDPSKGSLPLDYEVYSQSAGSYDLDMGARCYSEKGSFGAPGCKGSNGKVPTIDVDSQGVVIGLTFRFVMKDVLPDAPCFVILGSMEKGSWGGVKLPFNLKAYGAPLCSLNTDILHVLAAFADSTGRVKFLGGIPNQPQFVGHWLRYQGVALDRKSSSFGLTLSTGQKAQLCDYFPVCTVFGLGLTRSIGTMHFGRVPVSRFEYQ